MKKLFVVILLWLTACAPASVNALGTPIHVESVPVEQPTQKPVEVHVSVTCAVATPQY